MIQLGGYLHSWIFQYILVSTVMYAFIQSVNRRSPCAHGIPVGEDTQEDRQGSCSLGVNLPFREVAISK